MPLSRRTQVDTLMDLPHRRRSAAVMRNRIDEAYRGLLAAIFELPPERVLVPAQASAPVDIVALPSRREAAC
jgi:hypothetical protein